MLTRLVHVLQVLNVHRLTAGAWAKIGRHLGRSGASGLQAIQGKYRTLKQRSSPTPDAQPSPGRMLNMPLPSVACMVLAI